MLPSILKRRHPKQALSSGDCTTKECETSKLDSSERESCQQNRKHCRVVFDSARSLLSSSMATCATSSASSIGRLSSITATPVEDEDETADDVPERLVRAIYAQSWSVVLDIVSDHPEVASDILHIAEGNHVTKRVALHEAIRFNAPLEVVEALVEAYPDSVVCREATYKFLPIHFACRSGASPEVIQYLIRQYPESLLKEDKYGYIPERVAANSSASNKMEVLDVIRMHLPKTTRRNSFHALSA